MRGKRFEPRVVAITAGQKVTFPNLDPIYHNVFSLSGENRFDLGLYKDGASKSQSFAKSGVVRVFCNIHPDMEAFVLVLQNPFHARPGGDGGYEIARVPPGTYTLKAWDERGGEAAREVVVPAGASAEVDFELDATGFKRLPHKNKFNQSYGTEY
jgi:hypothetical protein